MSTTGLRIVRAAAAAFVAALHICGSAQAQTFPSEPLTFGGGRVVVGGDAALAVAPEDEGFFNYSDYEQTTLRQIRVGVSALVRLSERVSFLGELRSENFEYVTPFAAYARIRPFPNRNIDVQIGRIPPTFGRSSRRTYGHDNPLIGSPLAYQYLTSLRADSAPANADELLAMRGRGWLSQYSVGNVTADRGVPLVSAFTWDTGVQVSAGWKILTASVGVTNGTASNPRVSDDNGGKQIAARVTATPATGLAVGSSFARGEFLDRRVRALLPDTGHDYDQAAAEFDVEYSRDHWLARAETVWSRWTMPLGTGGTTATLRAASTALEGRYTFAPGWYGAARFEHLGFNRIATPTQTMEWEAPVRRLEVGGGYYLQRNLIVRTSLQFNRRDGGRVTGSQLLAVQLLYWF
jgi:hypothetical protein